VRQTGTVPTCESDPAARVVVFDAMGVLYRAADDVTELLIPYLADLGTPRTPAEIREVYRRASLGELTSAELWAACAPAGPRGDDVSYCARHELVPGIVALLGDLRQRGVPVACLSNDVSEWSVILRRRFGLEDLVTWWVISGDIGVRKPAPGAFEAVVGATGVPPAHLVFFDDRRDNVAGAAAAGLDAVQFTDADAARAALVERGILPEVRQTGTVPFCLTPA